MLDYRRMFNHENWGDKDVDLTIKHGGLSHGKLEIHRQKRVFHHQREMESRGLYIYIYTHTHTNKLGYDLEKTKHTNKAIRLSDLAFWIRCLSRWNRSVFESVVCWWFIHHLGKPMVLDEPTGKHNFVEPTVAGELDSTLGL